MTADKILEQIRGGQVQEDALKKYLGAYRTKDVEDYIEKLLNRLHNLETVYQERFEEMRTSLLDMTRERDEQSERANVFEQKLNDMPKYCDTYLKGQGLVAISKEEVEQIQNNAAEYDQAISEIKQENAKLLSELESIRFAQKEADGAKEQIEQIRMQALAQADECKQLSVQLQQQTQQAEQMKVETDAAIAECGQMKIELDHAQAQYQALEIQNQLTIDMNQQLIREKERQENEAVARQENWEKERQLLIRRFNGILQNQQQCMQRLQGSFNASLACMESLAEADFLKLPVE